MFVALSNYLNGLRLVFVLLLANPKMVKTFEKQKPYRLFFVVVVGGGAVGKLFVNNHCELIQLSIAHCEG